MPPRGKPIDDPELLGRLREEMERQQSLMDATKIAYLNNAPLGDHVPSVDEVRVAAQAFIDANYKYQKALFGRVRVKLSVANLLR